jgi:hypothetical protein
MRHTHSGFLVGLFSTLCLAASGCDADPVGPDDGYHAGPPVDQPPPAPSLSGFQTISFVTFDGSGQVVHPDWAFTPMDWFPHRQHLAITPYPGGNSYYELPSEYASENGMEWYTPEGGTNPVALHPERGYLSDPDQLYNPDAGELWMYYRGVDTENRIFLIRTGDGVTWTPKREVVSGPNHTVISPSVVRLKEGTWMMWSVNGGSTGCVGSTATVELRRSRNGTAWSPPITVNLNQPGFYPWHIEVQWIPSLRQFWAVYNVKAPGGCVTPALYLATSDDGVNWQTYSSPVLARDAIPELRDIVYRSTFSYDPASDAVTFWFSGARFTGVGYRWAAAMGRMDRVELFTRIFFERTEMGDEPWPTRTPPLTNETAP